MRRVKESMCLICGNKPRVHRTPRFDDQAWEVFCREPTENCLSEPIVGATEREAVLAWNQFQSFVKIRFLENEIVGLKMALVKLRDEAQHKGNE